LYSFVAGKFSGVRSKPTIPIPTTPLNASVAAAVIANAVECFE